jgi:hypothetical protein
VAIRYAPGQEWGMSEDQVLSADLSLQKQATSLGKAEHAAAEVGLRLPILVFTAETDVIHGPHDSQTNRRNMGRRRCRPLMPRLL